jgi:hypothetical protein
MRPTAQLLQPTALILLLALAGKKLDGCVQEWTRMSYRIHARIFSPHASPTGYSISILSSLETGPRTHDIL